MTSGSSSPSACLLCRGTVKPFMDFGDMPIANGFLVPSQFAEERFHPLRVGLCGTCGMVQLIDPVDRLQLFHAEYPFFSSTSQRMVEHFGEFARQVISDYSLGPRSFVVEIGSNDGSMLRYFFAARVPHLGIEPSRNVAAMARVRGLRTRSTFFDDHVAEDIRRKDGQADAILGANVLCHISALPSVIVGVKRLLKPKGVAIFEDPYIGDILEKTAYDQIYDEHAFYFSLQSLRGLFRAHGLELIDADHQPTHGGSMRCVFAHAGAHAGTQRLSEWLLREEALRLDQNSTYERFCDRIRASACELMHLMCELRGQGKRIVGYGATSKSTTVINYCGMNRDLVEYIADTSPGKQGKFSPGAHIPIRPHEEFRVRYPDYALLFAWNHAEEIMAKEQAFKTAGGKWITYVPQVKVLE